MAPEPQPDFELTVRTADGRTSTIRLVEDRYQLGRAPANQLCYTNAGALSRDHLAFERTPAGWLVRDLKSTNGTFANETRIQGAQLLQLQYRINAGDITMTFQAVPTVVFVDEGGTDTSFISDSIEA